MVKGLVGCNYGCSLHSGRDDWESAVFIVKRAANIETEKTEQKFIKKK